VQYNHIYAILSKFRRRKIVCLLIEQQPKYKPGAVEMAVSRFCVIDISRKVVRTVVTVVMVAMSSSAPVIIAQHSQNIVLKLSGKPKLVQLAALINVTARMAVI